MSELYEQALSLYKTSNYEKAFELLSRISERSREENALLNECKNQIIQQYIYLIKESINQSEIKEAKRLKNEFYDKYGFNHRISQINIPKTIPKENKEKKNEEYIKVTSEKKNIIDLKVRERLFFWVGLSIFIPIISIGIYKISLQKKTTSKNLDKTYLNEVNSNSNNHVLSVYSGENTWIYYWTNSNENNMLDGNILYRRNLKTGETNRLASLDQDFMMYHVDTFYVYNDYYLDIKGNNMSNSFMNNDIICRVNMKTGECKSLLMGRVINRTENQYIVSEMILIPSDKSAAESDYFSYEKYYNLDGELIDGKTLAGKGHIGKYPIFLHIYNYKNVIKGWYQYDGHTNFMTLSGELYDGNVFNMTEFNNSNIPFGSFRGKLDFDNKWMRGVWENKEGTKQLDFEIQEKPKINIISYEGDMAGFPIKIELIISDNSVKGEYKNIKYGTIMELKGELNDTDNTLYLMGRNNNETIRFKLKFNSLEHIEGYGISGDKSLKIKLDKI